VARRTFHALATMRTRTPLTLPLLLALAFPGAAARAQFGLDHVISNINVANVNTQGSCLLSTVDVVAHDGNRCGLYGVGMEIGLALSPDTARWQYELSVGYGQITGFQSRNPSLEMHGVMRLTPEVSFYVTRNIHPVSPYIGIHSGLVSLSGVQVYDSANTVYSFSANTLQLGATAGLYFPHNIYLDVGYRYRAFQSLNWTLPQDVIRLPAGWPRSLNMTALQATLGIEFDIHRLTGASGH
jgi:opacity protein-like surface antigen